MTVSNATLDRVMQALGDGCNATQMSDRLSIAYSTASGALNRLADDGRVFRARLAHKVVWFMATKELADAKVRDAGRPVKRPGVVVGVKVERRLPDGTAVVIPAGVKVQTCPSAWTAKPPPAPDVVTNGRPGALDYKRCGRRGFA